MSELENPFARLSAIAGGELSKPIEDMSEPEINALLTEEGTNVEALEKQFSDFLKRGQKELALEAARKRRQQIISSARQTFQSGPTVAAELLAKARSLIDALGARDPEQAAIFARKFETTTTEDIESLAYDVAVLEEMTRRDEDSNRSDQG